MAAAVVVEALSPLLTPQRIQKLRIAAALRCSNTHFGFENVWKNDNTAAALRSVECAGVQNVHLVRGEAVHKKRVNHSLSKSAERWLDIHYHSNTPEFLADMQNKGIAVFAADANPTATPIADLSVQNHSTCFVFGNEQHGVSASLRDGCDGLFFLPSVGLTQSYNVSAACAMTLMHLTDRGILKPDMQDEAQTAVLARWLLRTVPRAGQVLAQTSNLSKAEAACMLKEAVQRPRPFPVKTPMDVAGR